MQMNSKSLKRQGIMALTVCCSMRAHPSIRVVTSSNVPPVMARGRDFVKWKQTESAEIQTRRSPAGANCCDTAGRRATADGAPWLLLFFSERVELINCGGLNYMKRLAPKNYILGRLLKARTVKPAETAIARERLSSRHMTTATEITPRPLVRERTIPTERPPRQQKSTQK
jgi:hypothetical protein